MKPKPKQQNVHGGEREGRKTAATTTKEPTCMHMYVCVCVCMLCYVMFIGQLSFYSQLYYICLYVVHTPQRKQRHHLCGV